MILNDAEIHALCLPDPNCPPMIDPFEPKQIRWRPDTECLACQEWMIKPDQPTDHDHMRGCKAGKAISYGLSSFGYDLRVGPRFKVFTDVHCGEVDPKNFDANSFVEVDVMGKGYCLIPPHSFALAASVEWFNIPDDILTICLGKSTYARCGILVNVTPFEPGWRGRPTLEISNTTPLPCRVYALEGLAQVLFFRGKRPNRTYADREGGRGGKYQDQDGVIGPTV